MGELVEENQQVNSEKVYISKQFKVKERMTALKDLKAASGVGTESKNEWYQGRPERVGRRYLRNINDFIFTAKQWEIFERF